MRFTGAALDSVFELVNLFPPMCLKTAAFGGGVAARQWGRGGHRMDGCGRIGAPHDLLWIGSPHNLARVQGVKALCCAFM
jgi:hypothetical protein